ncbi:hypothetical protein [Endomicrobium proavitum]|uniref:CBM11 domain-containing protein n=1 Tax=Endomicrobium proavitum TaxID=1408281 RepID=A0A0G3WMJ9_9BACT|nr:hypothetical protein [Endomicrobium proavitum]AKL97998.1 exported protein of unknown function [Endomicrobium proavitum]AKL98714.1 exported protein of unknown function [Endomicrobium proavitum]
MKKAMTLVMAAAFVATGAAAAFGQAKAPAFKPFAVYVENASKANHFAPSGWMGDYGDLKISQASTDKPRSGNTAFKITYTAKMAQGAGWSGIYWQQPANNWGEKKGGYNLTGATKLTFWARGEQGGEKIAEFKVGGITGEFPDSDSQSIGPVVLTKEWQKFTIDLKGKDLTHIIGGFCFAASKDDNPNGFVIYIDDIIYE